MWLERIDRYLNWSLIGSLLILIGVMVADDPGSSSSSQFNLSQNLDMSNLLEVMGTSCETIDERLAYFRACIDDAVVTEDDGITTTRLNCPVPAPLGITETPITVSLTETFIRMLETRKGSERCQAVPPSEELIDDANRIGWSALQQRILELEEEPEHNAEGEAE